MRIISALFFAFAMLFIGTVEAAPTKGTQELNGKIYVGSSSDQRYFLYMYQTANCPRVYGYKDFQTGVEKDLPSTTFTCTSRYAPKLLSLAGGAVYVVQKLDADSFYTKNLSDI